MSSIVISCQQLSTVVNSCQQLSIVVNSYEHCNNRNLSRLLSVFRLLTTNEFPLRTDPFSQKQHKQRRHLWTECRLQISWAFVLSPHSSELSTLKMWYARSTSSDVRAFMLPSYVNTIIVIIIVVLIWCYGNSWFPQQQWFFFPVDCCSTRAQVLHTLCLCDGLCWFVFIWRYDSKSMVISSVQHFESASSF